MDGIPSGMPSGARSTTIILLCTQARFPQSHSFRIIKIGKKHCHSRIRTYRKISSCHCHGMTVSIRNRDITMHLFSMMSIPSDIWDHISPVVKGMEAIRASTFAFLLAHQSSVLPMELSQMFRKIALDLESTS